MQHHLKTSSIIGTLIFLGLTSRDLNTHLPLLRLHQDQSAAASHAALAQNSPTLIISQKMNSDL
ncbi:hypothetical protein [Methylophilus aquaticus]|uniref:Uncharacterized protein n=1 Tax=Methylophilus aquaticus TaxID=1971610 RepID=A0ABT9JPN1_9PROT|nr:hypothetical protein [Methylophilus aquaticus]MDP8566522.1 hypothetical protein [Methylophilus aquaticus]